MIKNSLIQKCMSKKLNKGYERQKNYASHSVFASLIDLKKLFSVYISAIVEVFMGKMIQNLRITGKPGHFDTLRLEYYIEIT